MNRWRAFSQLVLAVSRVLSRAGVILGFTAFSLDPGDWLEYRFSRKKPEPPSWTFRQPFGSGSKGPDGAAEGASSKSRRTRWKKAMPPAPRKTALYIIPRPRPRPRRKAMAWRTSTTNPPEGLWPRYWSKRSCWASTGRSARRNRPNIEETRSRYIDFLIPGPMGMNLMARTFGVGFVLVDMRVRKLFKRFLATPMIDVFSPGNFHRPRLSHPEMLALLALGWFRIGVPLVIRVRSCW